MTEDFTSAAVAYLLQELAPAARAEFEARLASDSACRAELKEIANALGLFAGANAPAEALPLPLKEEMLEEVLRARGGRIRTFATLLQKSAWPLAAGILLTLNIGQWLYHRHEVQRGTSAAPVAELQSPPASRNETPRDLPVIPVAAKLSRPLGTTATAPAPTPVPSIRQTVTFSISQTTVATKAPVPPQQQGALELHGLPRVSDDLTLYLWARRAGGNSYEPVGEVPRQLYGGSGTINYQLRPGTGAAVHFIVTVEDRNRVPPAPSRDVVCAGP